MPSKEYLEEKARKEKENQNSGKIVAVTFVLCFLVAAGYIIMYGQ